MVAVPDFIARPFLDHLLGAAGYRELMVLIAAITQTCAGRNLSIDRERPGTISWRGRIISGPLSRNRRSPEVARDYWFGWLCCQWFSFFMY
jgi:hypothetical protein